MFWAFLILATVYLEAYGSLIGLAFGREHLEWAIPVIGHWPVLGFLQDFIAMMAFFGILTFVWIRLRNAPKDLGRRSRFFGSHLSGAWITLFMIFNVIWTMFLFRGASSALGTPALLQRGVHLIGVGNLLDGLSHGALEVLEGIGLLLHIGVMLVFLIFVLNSKHLHIFVAPLNVLFGRRPVALGAVKPLVSAGQAGHPRRHRGPRRGRPARHRARSRTSPGRVCSTSPPAPSAAAASHSARPGTPRSRCRPSS